MGVKIIKVLNLKCITDHELSEFITVRSAFDAYMTHFIHICSGRFMTRCKPMCLALLLMRVVFLNVYVHKYIHFEYENTSNSPNIIVFVLEMGPDGFLIDLGKYYIQDMFNNLSTSFKCQ
ncbi:hypothetical protein RUM43_005335 [Polyplax serrata]|uniref:Uncharacterized protein n=1 Tax=Polyplax serrata TaxID=468196 RepID=A0AAN8S8L7_POLSC